VAERRTDSGSDLLAGGYTSTVLGIAGFSLLACTSLLMTLPALSDLEPGTLPGSDLATALQSMKF
jgi:hypothetical protein